jgi:hypothetical protein
MSFQHPLDPLSHSEQELIVAHARKAWKLEAHHLFAMLQLHEPTKAELGSGKKLDRTARVTIWDRKRAVVSEGLITTNGVAKEFVEIPGAKSPVSAIESAIALEVVYKNQSVKDVSTKKIVKNIKQTIIEFSNLNINIEKIFNRAFNYDYTIEEKELRDRLIIINKHKKDLKEKIKKKTKKRLTKEEKIKQKEDLLAKKFKTFNIKIKNN